MARLFRRISDWAANAVGTPWFFGANLALIVAWVVWGLIGGFGEFMQAVITTILTVTTQLLVILIQATQNRDGRAVHLKLDEVLRALDAARTELARAEEMTEQEIENHIDEIKREGG